MRGISIVLKEKTKKATKFICIFFLLTFRCRIKYYMHIRLNIFSVILDSLPKPVQEAYDDTKSSSSDFEMKGAVVHSVLV